MNNNYKIAIVGAGPAGLSAAGRAQYLDRASNNASPSYVLLEAFDKPAKTIQRYQKGKLVMAEPGYLDLRSDFSFQQGSREQVLAAWQSELEQQGVNIRYQSEVASISGQKGAFVLALKNGESITAENVIIAVGLEGNPRKLGVPGEDEPIVQYSLDDPDACQDEDIVVVGAGDSAIENALALAEKNRVYLLNRRDEFSRAKEGNLNKILAANADDNVTLQVLYSTTVTSLDNKSGSHQIVLNTPEGEKTLPVNRVIARLGGIPPRKFVESAGVQFPNEKADAIPDLNDKYESNVPGVYIVGSLAGYPLIKQALNQGYDVVEYIHGNDVKPADHALLDYQFKLLPYQKDADDLIRLFQQRIPIFKRMNALQFREVIIESDVLVAYEKGAMLEDMQAGAEKIQQQLSQKAQAPRHTRVIAEGDYLYRDGEYSSSFFTVLEGEVVVEGVGDEANQTYSRGQFFGENSLLSGRPREGNAIAGKNCVLVETPRRIMLKLMNSNDDVREGVDLVFVIRTMQKLFTPNLSTNEMIKFAAAAQLRSYKPGETLFEQGEKGESLHIVRSGSVTLSREVSGKKVVVAQYQTGKIIGEMALMGDQERRETAIANVHTQTIELANDVLYRLLEADKSRLAELQGNASSSVVLHTRMEAQPELGSVTDFLMAEGLGEATNCLLIDESLCVGCDNCEKACAETHNGISRLDREAGASFQNVHVPFSCRHCAQPHCMKDCPPNAIHRAPNGEVYIDDSCIGCGNCESNCPYDAIKLAYDAPPKPAFWSWLLFGNGPGPGEESGYQPEDAAKEKGKKAVKCDACMSLKSGPACVSACPTGAAIRTTPAQFIELVEKR